MYFNKINLISYSFPNYTHTKKKTPENTPKTQKIIKIITLRREGDHPFHQFIPHLFRHTPYHAQSAIQGASFSMGHSGEA